MMAKPGACVSCKEPLTNQTILTCSEQPCHVACATRWRKSRHPIINCPYCSQWRCISVIELINPQQWKEDPKFVEEVKRIWKYNPLWYGICHQYEGTDERFWGTLFNAADVHKVTHFLGHTQSEVIPHMKALNPPPTSRV